MLWLPLLLRLLNNRGLSTARMKFLLLPLPSKSHRCWSSSSPPLFQAVLYLKHFYCLTPFSFIMMVGRGGNACWNEYKLSAQHEPSYRQNPQLVCVQKVSAATFLKHFFKKILLSSFRWACSWTIKQTTGHCVRCINQEDATRMTFSNNNEIPLAPCNSKPSG